MKNDQKENEEAQVAPQHEAQREPQQENQNDFVMDGYKVSTFLTYSFGFLILLWWCELSKIYVVVFIISVVFYITKGFQDNDIIVIPLENLMQRFLDVIIVFMGGETAETLRLKAEERISETRYQALAANKQMAEMYYEKLTAINKEYYETMIEKQTEVHKLKIENLNNTMKYHREQLMEYKDKPVQNVLRRVGSGVDKVFNFFTGWMK